MCEKSSEIEMLQKAIRFSGPSEGSVWQTFLTHVSCGHLLRGRAVQTELNLGKYLKIS